MNHLNCPLIVPYEPPELSLNSALLTTSLSLFSAFLTTCLSLNLLMVPYYSASFLPGFFRSCRSSLVLSVKPWPSNPPACPVVPSFLGPARVRDVGKTRWVSLDFSGFKRKRAAHVYWHFPKTIKKSAGGHQMKCSNKIIRKLRSIDFEKLLGAKGGIGWIGSI